MESNRLILLSFLFILLVVSGYVLIKRYNLGKYGRIGVIVLGVCLWVCLGYLISINTIPQELQEKVDSAIEMCGSDSVRQDGSRVYVNVSGSWIDISKIKLLGDFTKDLYLEYDGNRIYVGHSGLYNTLRTLSSLGLLELW